MMATPDLSHSADIRADGGPCAVDLDRARDACRSLLGLSPDELVALCIVATLETVPDVSTLATVCGCTVRAAEVVSCLRARGLLEPGDPLCCTRAAMATLSATPGLTGSRGPGARALSGAIDAGADDEWVVRLAAATPPANDPVVVDVLTSAAARAVRHGRPSEALDLLRRALREPPAPDRAIELRGQLALAAVQADEQGAPNLVRLAAREMAPVEAAQLTRRAAALLGSHGRSRAAVAMVDDVRRYLGAADREVESILGLGWLCAARVDLSMRPAVRRRIEALHTEDVDTSPSGRALAGLTSYELSLAGEDLNRSVELARHCLDIGGGGTLSADLSSIWSAVLALCFADELAAARAAVDRLEERGRRRGRDADIVGAHHLRVPIARSLGEMEVARRSAEVVADAVRQGWNISVPGIAGNRCRLELVAGRLDAAEASLVLPGGVEAFADDPSLVEYLDARGHLRFRQGRHAEALEDHLRVRDRHAALGSPNPATMLWAHGATRALVALGRRSEAASLHEEHLERARRWGAPRPIGILLASAASLRLVRGCDDDFEEAFELLDRAGARVDLAEAHLLAAATSAARGRRLRAERDARRARFLAASVGATAIETGAASLLSEVGGVADRSGRLTPAEIRTARLAASGASNAEIAADLFVSRKAVEYHLSNAYRKLGIAGRRELDAALRQVEDLDGARSAGLVPGHGVAT